MEWKLTAEGAELTYFAENDGHAEIPASAEEKPVIAIGPKAFLSRKNLQEVRFPASIQRIGSWAFAHAASLRTVFVYGKNVETDDGIVLGKDVFLGCERLNQFAFENDTYVGIAALRAAAARLGASGLLRPAVERSKTWLAEWDELLLSFLEEEDGKGFLPMQAGGEEDYESEQEQRQFYERGRCKRKAELCYLRLLYEQELEADKRAFLSGYLCTHINAAWEVLLEKHLLEKEYYRILHQAGGITQANFGSILEDMQRAGAGAEQQAFLLDRMQKTHMPDSTMQAGKTEAGTKTGVSGSFFQTFQL